MVRVEHCNAEHTDVHNMERNELINLCKEAYGIPVTPDVSGQSSGGGASRL